MEVSDTPIVPEVTVFVPTVVGVEISVVPEEGLS